MNIVQKAGQLFYQTDRLFAKPFLNIRNLQLRAAAMAVSIAAVVWLAASLAIPLAPFGPNSLCTNDGYAQYMPFLSEFWSIFREGGSPLYSFHGALGSNFYLTMAYYLFSPFTFLCLLFDKAQIPAAANLIIILKNILVIGVMAWYLPSRSRNAVPFLAAAVALVYGFSFYFLGYAVNFMWMDSIALVPLMLYGMERIHTPKGRVLYLGSLAGAVLMNFYMGAVICIFLALYYVLLCWKWNREGWKRFFWFAACSVAAVLIAGIVLVPVIRGMLMDNTSRMKPPSFEIFNDPQYFFSRLLPDAEVVRITHNRGTINLYMGTASLFGTLLFLQAKTLSRRVRLGLSGLCLLYLASTQISTLNYVFHGFYLQRQVPNRYGFLIAMLTAVMMYQGFLCLRSESFKRIGIAGILCACFFAGISTWCSFENLWMAFVLAGVVILYLLAALFKRRRIIAWMLILESIGGMVMLAPGGLDSSYTEMGKFIQAAKVSTGGRAEILCSEIVNAPMLYGMNGVSAFNSVINPKTAGLLGKLGFASGENYYRFYGYTPISALFLGVRDIITDKDALMPAPFVETAQFEDLSLWTSPYETAIGFVIPDARASMDSSNKFDNLNVLYPDAFVPLSVSASLSGESGHDTSDGKYLLKDIQAGDRNTLTLKPFSADAVYLYANAGGSRNFRVEKNGETLADNKYEGNIVYLGNVNESDVIEVTFEAEDKRSEQTIRLQAASLSPDHMEAAARFYLEHGLKDQKVFGNTISGTYFNEDPQTMIFTIPYDQGWSARVNGRTVPVSSWQNALVSIPLDAGDNEISLVYQPAGLKEGMAVSLLGLLLAAALLGFPFWKKRRKASRIFEARSSSNGQEASSDVSLPPFPASDKQESSKRPEETQPKPADSAPGSKQSFQTAPSLPKADEIPLPADKKSPRLSRVERRRLLEAEKTASETKTQKSSLSDLPPVPEDKE